MGFGHGTSARVSLHLPPRFSSMHGLVLRERERENGDGWLRVWAA